MLETDRFREAPWLSEPSWVAVENPDGWNWTDYPFTIYRRGRQFKVDPTFDLRAYANISVVTEYYVDSIDGDNANSGADWDNAFETLKFAMQKADVDRVYVRGGSYFFTSGKWWDPGRDMEIISVGGSSTATIDIGDTIGAWTAVGNHYEAVVAALTTKDVWDASLEDDFDDHVRLTEQASIAAVDANAGSWFQSGLNIYVRTADDREPDSDLRFYYGDSACEVSSDNRIMYIENMKFYGGQRVGKFLSMTAAGGTKLYFRNCDFKYSYNSSVVDVNGVDELIFQNCTVAKSIDLDGFNYKDANGIIPDVIEIDCEVYDCGDGGADQASSMHDGGRIIRVMGKYHHVAGQCISDIEDGQTWCLGTEVYNSASGIGFNSDVSMWLDRCRSFNNPTFDLRNLAGTIIRERFLKSDGNFDINGTLEEY